LKIVHLADSHLGYASNLVYDQHGRNRIEEMVYTGFEKAVDKILQLRPDAVVHAGDVFHHVRPKIRPLVVFQRGLYRLSQAGIPLIIISGNHDAPKSSYSTSPFLLFEGYPGVMIARNYRYESFSAGDYSFHCIPFCLDPRDYVKEFENIKRSGRDVLVIHGLVEALRSRKLRTVGEHELKDSLLKREFDYIALGHYHGRAQIAENAWYSGSIEYFNFAEADDLKGMLLVDLEKGKVEPVEVRPRYMLDCPPVDCSGLSSEEIAERLMELCRPQDIKDRIVRITLEKVNRSAYRRLDSRGIKRMGAPAIYLKVRAEFEDEQERIERPLDRQRMHEDFGRFLESEAARGHIPPALTGEVSSYGSMLLREAVEAKNAEALYAPQ
jgi:exonuclease SbcD